MGLQSRLLAGLALLVSVAIVSTGWLTLEVARGRLERAEEERARALGEAVAGLLGGIGSDRGLVAPGAGLVGGESVATRRLRAAARALQGVGGIEDLALVDAMRRPIVGEAGDDAGFAVVLGGGGTISRRARGMLAVYAPIRGESGGATGALRLRLAVGRTLGDAVAGSTRLLLALTLADGGLILIFGALFLLGVTRPLEQLSRAARRVAEGDLEGPEVPAGTGEVGTLIAAFNRMTGSLREQRASLAASREQVLAQEKLATVGRLAAGVAHEIGNPLTAILGYVDLLLRDPRDADTVDSLRRVRGETERIHRIVHDLLEFSRPVAEDVEPVRLVEVLHSAVDLLRPQPRFRQVAVAEHLPAELPPVAASARRLLQVMLNLLLNAADAMGGEGEVRIGARVNGAGAIELDVADSGPGVKSEDGGRLFDPFFTTKEPGAGTGLGLAVCRSIVQAYGGAIALVPSEKGATFRVTLPAWK